MPSRVMTKVASIKAIWTSSRTIMGVVKMWYNTGMLCPLAVRACLWSYNIPTLDLERDKTLIVTNVLNYGTKEATDWLFSHYSASSISAVIHKPLPGRWDGKSLALWSLIFGVTPELKGRFSDAYALRSIG